jgi:DNA-binding GntR family transcriptional regulator
MLATITHHWCDITDVRKRMADDVADPVVSRFSLVTGEPASASPIVAQLPQFRPLRSDAYEALREAILLGRLRPGQRIVEAEIARQMGISRGPIREAVRQLEQEDLVVYNPRRGVVVARLTREAAEDTYAVRAELDGFAARLAAARIGDDQLAQLDGLIDTMRGRAREGDNDGLLNTDVDFHRTIYVVAGNRVLQRAWTSLGPHAWTLFSGIQLRGYSLSDLAERHLPILEALRTGDPVTAEHAAKQHTLEIARNVLDHLDNSSQDLAAGSLRMIMPDR